MSDYRENLTADDSVKTGSFKKEILYSYATILRAKFRNFRKKSLLKYTAASLIYSGGLIVVRGGKLFTLGSVLVFLNFFLIFLSLSFILMIISSGILARKYQGWKMIYTFSASGIHVRNEMNGQEEDHDWDWIASHELTGRTLFLQVRSSKPFEIILDRDKLSPRELDSILKWLG